MEEQYCPYEVRTKVTYIMQKNFSLPMQPSLFGFAKIIVVSLNAEIFLIVSFSIKKRSKFRGPCYKPLTSPF